MTDEIADIKKRAGITEQTTHPGYYTKLADTYTRFIMGDPERAMRQMEELHRSEGAPGMQFGGAPGDYNRLYRQVYEMMLKAIETAQGGSDTGGY